MMKKIDIEITTLVANYGHKFSDKIKFESNLRVAETFLQYDTEDKLMITADDNSMPKQVDGLESSSSVA